MLSKQRKTFKKAPKMKKFPKKKKESTFEKVEEKDDDQDESSEEETDGRPRISDFGNDTPWYEEFNCALEEKTPLSDPARFELRKEAGAIFEQEATANFGKVPKSIPKSDYNWIKTVISKGTISDKIAAYVLLIQDNPTGNMSYLKNMISMTKVGKKRECFMTVDTLVELFLENLLPPNRKLKFFAQQPLSLISKISKGSVEKRRRLLLLWFFEDQLKTLYTSFIKALNDAAHDSVEANKERVIAVLQKLLQGHPEQESALLSSLVNKLGDPSHKIGSKVIYSLTKLLDVHPAMKTVVMEEVEKVIFRPNMGKRAQYYSVCFLNQFSLDNEDSALASGLISIYFALFKACIKTGEIDSRMMSALLTGVSRAYPFAKSDSSILKDHIDTVYKVVHLSSANVAIHALSLLYLVVGDTLTDRFMTVLYKKIGEIGMFISSNHAMFLSIVFKTLKRDPDDGRVYALMKRLLQIAVQLPVPVICGILMLISQVAHARKNFSLQLRQDANIVLKLEEDEDDDGEEHYKDANPEVEAVKSNIEIKLDEDGEETRVKKEAGGSSWYHAALKPQQASNAVSNSNEHYDPYQRNPLHANGGKTVPAELTELARHFHPTVALFAANILEGSKISYSGDPLQDFTLIRFLDKFVFKNPKQLKSSNQQVSTFGRFGRKKLYESVGLKKLRVNTQDYLNHDEASIPVDETYLYKYLKDKESKNKKVKKEKKGSDSEDEDDEEASETESVGDEEFDDILSKVGAGGKDDLDFLNEIGSLPTDKKGKKGAVADEEDESEGSEDEEADLEDDDESGEEPELDDEDDDFDDEDDDDLDSNAEDFEGDEMDDLGVGDELDTDDEDDELSPPKKSKKSMKGGKLAKKSKGGGLFAAAEEFSELLDDDQYMSGSSSAVSNKDRAAVKQLKWEEKRDRWVKGNNHFKRGRNKNSGGPPNKRKQQNFQNSNASKKRRKTH